MPAPFSNEIDFGGEPEAFPGYEDRPPLTDALSYVSYVTRKFEQWADERYVFEPGWYTDLAFFLGQQWARWYEGTSSLELPQSASRKTRITINKVKPAIRTLMGKLLRGMPDWQVSPANTSESAKAQARVGRQLLPAQYRRLGVFDVQRDTGLWMLTTGTGFVDTSWDPSLGDVIEDLEGRPMFTGDVSVTSHSPFAVYVPRWVKDLVKPCTYILGELVSLDILRAQFPDTALDVASDDWMSERSFYEDMVMRLASPTGGFVAGTSTNMVFRLKLWEDPQVLAPWEREECPNGRYTIVANGKLLWAGDNPYKTSQGCPKHTLTRFRADPFPGRFWGMSPVDDMLSIQMAINAAASQVSYARKMTTMPKLVTQKDANLGRVSSGGLEILEYRAGTPAPKFLDPPAVNQWTIQDQDRLEKACQDVIQNREVSEGGLPAANLTGVGIQLLQDADNTPWHPMAVEYANGMGLVGQMVLDRSSQGYTEPRVFEYTNDLDEEDVLEFHSDGELLPVRTKVSESSVMPEPKAVREARITGLVQAGLLNPQVDRPKIFRMLEFGDADMLYVQFAPDHARARRENKKLLRGRPVQRQSFDVDEIHVSEHTDYMKSAEYESLPMEQQQAFVMHNEEHLMAIAQLKLAMAPAPGMEPGGPGGGAPTDGAGSPSSGQPNGAPPTGPGGPPSGGDGGGF